MSNALRSIVNEILLQLRLKLKFRRSGYSESGDLHLSLSSLEQDLQREFDFLKYKKHLTSFHYRRNLATLWYLKKIFAGAWNFQPKEKISILEPGCQDFARLPALKAFFKRQTINSVITGLELDAFPILSDFHSRWDHAMYYKEIVREGDEYVCSDFFKWTTEVDGIICFYPFVSVRPAVAWGLPQRFAQVELWMASFNRVLQNQGFLVVAHQGVAEQEIFDHCRNENYPLFKVVNRLQMECPFWASRQPVCMTLYQKRIGD